MRFGRIALLGILAACGGKADEADGLGQPGPSGTLDDPALAAPSPAAPTRPACAVEAPFQDSFESSYYPWGGVANPGNLRITTTDPIAGNASLEILTTARYPRAYLVHSVAPAACAASVALTVRAEAAVLAPGTRTTIARLLGEPSSLDVVLDGGRVEIVETQGVSQDSSGIAYLLGPIGAETPTEIRFTFDLSAGLLSGSVSEVGAPDPPRVAFALSGMKDPVRDLLVGLWATTATGTYWLDDVSLE